MNVVPSWCFFFPRGPHIISILISLISDGTVFNKMSDTGEQMTTADYSRTCSAMSPIQPMPVERLLGSLLQSAQTLLGREGEHVSINL
jgi:hypothetical protein